MSDTEGVRPTDPTCSVPGCSNPATTTALQDGAPVCRECADKAARRWEAQEREDESEDALDLLLPSEQVAPEVRAAVLSLFAEGRARAVLSTPAVLRTCQALAAMDEWAGLNGAIKAIIARQAGQLIGRDAAAAVLGTFDRRSRTWADAPAEAPAAGDVDLVQTFAELEADDGALSEVLFPALAYRSRAVLAFGHRGQSKTSVCTWAARELSRAGLKVLVVGGDDPHTWRAALPRMGAFLQNVSYARGQAESDMREAGLKARSQTIRERLKCVRDARDARDAPTVPMHAEGASVRPDPREGRRDAPAAGESVVLNATIPDWQERAEKLGLDGDLMKWTEPQWQAIMAREIAA